MSLLWLRVAVLLYCLAALAVLPAALYDRPRWRFVALPAALVGALFQFVSLVEMLAAEHHAFPVGRHESQSFLALLFVLAFVGVSLRYGTLALGVFLLPLAVLLMLEPALHTGSETLPLAHSNWIFLHIALLLAAYAALLLSLLASVLYLIQERRLKRKQPSLRGLPALETSDGIARRALLVGLPCMTAGLLIGATIAEITVGPAYFRDPKVLLSFAMWLVYVGMMHIRQHAGLRGRRAIYLSAFVFFFVLAVWSANQLSAVHRFTAP